MKKRRILYFVLFVQFLIFVHYSQKSWRISDPVFAKLFLPESIETYSSANVFPSTILPGTDTTVKKSEINNTEKTLSVAEVIVDVHQNISIKLPVADSSRYSTIRGLYGDKFMPQFDKFLFTGPKGGRLGNQMCRFAALYAMGQSLGRWPAYVAEDKSIRESEQEIAALFPTFYGMIHYISPAAHLLRKFPLARRCCDYQDPIVLRNFSEPLLELTGVRILFEHYKYFHNERKRIREIFNFSQEVRQRVQKNAANLYRDNKSHKLCIHVRTDDFKPFHWESTPDSTSEAIKRIVQNFTTESKDYSLVFLGQDKEFFKQVNLTEQEKRFVFVTPNDISRGDEMCLGATTCDSLLITAHMSTYAFWIGYLMPENSRIYYIANLKPNMMHTPGQFPPEWVQFEL